jgi:hypothetical protein
MASVIDLAQAAAVDVAVHLGCREGAVPKQLLDDAQVGAALEQMGRERMPEAMRVGEKSPERARVQPSAARGEKQGILGAAGQLRSRVLQIEPNAVGRLFAERDDPLLVPFAPDANGLLFEVDVSEVEVDRLAAAQAGRVDELEQGAVSQGERFVAAQPLENGVDLIGLESCREPPGAARPDLAVRDSPGAEFGSEQPPNGRQLPRDRGARELSRLPSRPRGGKLGGIGRQHRCVDVLQACRPAA